MQNKYLESKASYIDKVFKLNNNFRNWCSSHPFDPFKIEISDTFIVGSIPPVWA